MNMETTFNNIESDIESALQMPAERIGDTLSSLRTVIDLRERLGKLDKQLAERREALECKLRDYQKREGVNSFADAGLSVTFDPGAFRAKYEPEHFNGILKWAVETGNEFVVQRRLTDAKILGLVDEGVPLPEGLSVEQYTKISVKRK